MALLTTECAATSLLLPQRLHSLRFDLTKLRYDKTIVFDTLQHFCATTRATLQELTRCSDSRDGMTLVRRQGGRVVYVVLYNELMRDIRRRRFTLAHEIGHIVLGHLDDEACHEQEANQFAAQLLMPRILVDQLRQLQGHTFTPYDLCSCFYVSREAAEHRLRSLSETVRYTADDYALLQRFGKLLPTPDDPIVSI